MKSGLFTSSLVALSFVAFPAFAKGNSNNLGVKKNSVQVEAEVSFDAATELAIVKIVNEERAAVGLGPVAIDPRLREAARGHSRDMGELGFFDHVSPVKGKAKFTDRIKAQGLAKFGTAGENIAMIGGGNQNRALQFMDMWMNSEGHRANILGEDYNYIGVGVYITADGQVFATQEFSSLGDTKASPKSPISAPDIEIEAPQMTGPQVAPPQTAPEDIFDNRDEDEIFDNGQEEIAPSNQDEIQAKKNKIKGILDSRSGGQEVTPEYAPYNNGSYDDAAARKAKILSILEERSESDNSQEGVVIIVVPSRQPTYQYQQPTYQQPYQQPYHRSYYTPKKKSGCN